MALVDWAIVLIMVLAVLGGLTQGFFRSVFSLVGLVLPLVRIEAVANAIGFLLIALIVMGLAGFAGKILSKVFHQMGLGCLDRLAGAAFGFFQGALLVTLVILAALAFFPKADRKSTRL